MKRGEFAVAPAPDGTQPDLSGLSCRFEEIPSTRGVMLSVLVLPAKGADAASFARRSRTSSISSNAAPMPAVPCRRMVPPLRWPPQGVEYETRAMRGGSLASAVPWCSR
jgi:hypothetical protein